MALNALFRSHRTIPKIFLKTTINYEMIVVSNVRYFSSSSQKTKMTNKSYSGSKVRTINKIYLPKNMILRHCSPSHSDQLLDGMVEPLAMTGVRRPLTLIFAWLLAQDKHLEKYIQFWFEKGFDVLTVRTSPLDLLIPPIGSRIIAKDLVKVLSQLNSQYNEIIVHAFSVGGYQFGETLLEMKGLNDGMNLMNLIKGVIFDSITFPADVAPGLSRTITLNPIVQPIIENSIYLFLKLFHNISVKNYLEAENIIVNPLAKYPDDVISSVKNNEILAQNWSIIGNKMQTKCWDHSAHVLHYRDHQTEYEQELNKFIRKLNLRNNNF